ncbi:hypothetical protein LJC62_04905, partial [Odoribacter sp. OttesenSCG-928-A06]|nr:hypothetical protein [Odoribacter sp. OttesenSCG-928-A06]
ISLSISAYCSVLFVFFNSLSLAVSNNFTAQLLSLVSLIFLRSLYVGIQEIEELQDGKKINLMIIGSSLIICIPIIIRKLCMIILHVPAFNI